MQIDVLGQLLVPGDFVVHHGYRSIEFGVYIGEGVMVAFIYRVSI